MKESWQTWCARALWRFLAGAVGLSLLISPLSASAWWNAEWPYRKQIGLSGAETPALGGQVQQVLVPIRLHAGNFPFVDAQEGGSDLRFMAADDKTPLNFHFEQFDGVDEVAIAWVQVPSVGGKDSAILMYYGNIDAPAAGSTKASFDPLTVLAMHFAERDGLPHDSTGYGNSVLKSSGQFGANGAVGFGMALAADQSMQIAGAPSLSTPAGTGWTVAVWVKAAQAAASGTLLVRQENGRRLVLGLEDGKPYLAVDDAARAGSSGRIAAQAPIDGASWHHIAFVLGDSAALFVDGVEVAQGTLRLPEFSGDVIIGDAGGATGFAGEIDELQISNRMRAAEWIRAAAIAQDPQSRLADYGGDESGGGSDYVEVMRTLAAAVSAEGWVIIALICLMGLISGEVMIVKLRLLNRMRTQNEAFLDAWRQSDTPLARMDPQAVAEAGETWRDSPLLHLYMSASNEMHGLLAAGHSGALSPQALEVIRSGIDAGMVGEAHRMNDRMVTLTLAVSGAPFLGLLGTVVGIMITFGAIAMAGDVNVNTIAPGVAAALATTVAGLLVAIPVMFGYNQLATRIKELTAGMEVFASGLVGRIALRSTQPVPPGPIAAADAQDLQAAA